MKTITRAMTMVSTFAVLTGCGDPGVYFDPPPAVGGDVAAAVKAAKDGAVPVVLPASRIAVARAKPQADGKPAPGDEYEVTVVPRPGERRYLVRPLNNLASQNVLTVEYVEGTEVVKTVKNSFTDLTAKRVEQVASGVTSVLGVAARTGLLIASSSSPCAGATLPALFLDVTKSPDVPQSGTVPDSGDCFSWTLRLSDAAQEPPADSITTEQFAALVADQKDKSVRFWPVAVCRDVTFTLNRQGMDKPALQVRRTIADPSRLRLFPLPAAGKIAMHPVCGADFSDTPIDRWQAVVDTLSAIDKQVQSVGKKLEENQ